MTDEKKTERMTLTITQVLKIVEVGEKKYPKLPFKAKGADGKELPYFSFRPALFEHIKEGAIIDAEVEISKWETEQGSGWNRKLIQIYVDGQPVATKGSGRQFGQFGKSPEEMALERRSFEGQMALKELGEMIRASGNVPDIIIDEFRTLWQDTIKAKIAAFTNGSPIPLPPKVQGPQQTEKAPAKEESTSADTVVDDESRKLVDEIDFSPIKNAGELFSRCRNYDIPRDEALEVEPHPETDFLAAWRKIAAAKLRTA